MRLAVVGCGFFAHNHLSGWRDLATEGVELVAVCDIDPKRAEEAAKTFAVPRFYADAGALLDKEKVDCVDIVTRMETHLQVVKIVAARGVDIILQKPLGPDWDQAREIVGTARKAGVRLAVHENFRWQSPMRKLKGVLDSGAIGRPTWARIAFRTGYDIYAVQPYLHQARRYAILDVGIHVLDLARFFLGEVERVFCEAQTRNPDLLKAIALLFAQSVLLVSMTIMVSTFATSSLFSIIIMLLVYFCAPLSAVANEVWKSQATLLGRAGLMFINFFIPDLSSMTLVDDVVVGKTVSMAFFWSTCGYAAFYSLVVFALGALIFQEKEL